jgi:cytochrome c556
VSVRTADHLILGVLVAAAALAACSPKTSPTVEPRMVGHFVTVGKMHDAAAAGDLPALHAVATELLSRETGEGMPRKAAPYIEEYRMFAQLAARAPDVASGASAVARVGAACGSCHRTVKRGPQYKLVSGPPEGETAVATRMIRHRWAADRLWEGLVGPSDALWQAGAEALRDAPLFTDALTRDVAQYEAVTKLAWEVHEIGALANTAREQSRRAELYGDLLATCAACHNLLRIGE